MSIKSETEWLESTKSLKMLWGLLRPKFKLVNRRKGSLVLVAACRKMGPLLIHARSRSALDTLEAFVDGHATEAELRKARREANEAMIATKQLHWTRRERTAASAVDFALMHFKEFGLAISYAAFAIGDQPNACEFQANIIRDVFLQSVSQNTNVRPDLAQVSRGPRRRAGRRLL